MVTAVPMGPKGGVPAEPTIPLILSHPPLTQSFPTVDEASKFYPKRVQATEIQKKRFQFCLGQKRQKILRQEGFVPFNEVYTNLMSQMLPTAKNGLRKVAPVKERACSPTSSANHYPF